MDAWLRRANIKKKAHCHTLPTPPSNRLNSAEETVLPNIWLKHLAFPVPRGGWKWYQHLALKMLWAKINKKNPTKHKKIKPEQKKAAYIWSSNCDLH